MVLVKTDIIGGSSEHFGLALHTQRPDDDDEIYGGNGDLIDRNNSNANGHSRDADVILGDNGNIYRIVDGSGFISFAYDNYGGESIVVRAADLIDYTPGGQYGGADYAIDNGAADTIRGESGDDAIYGMRGNDILFGDSDDDDLIGGYGHDWISGGNRSRRCDW